MKIWNLLLALLILGISFFTLVKSDIKDRIDALTIKHISYSTVVVLDQVGSGLYLAKCAGVWIGEYYFLTANHCLDNGVEVVYQVYGVEDGLQLGMYDRGYSGVVLKVDSDLDLALVMGIGGDHGVVTLGTGGVVGDKVWGLGHPNLYTYTLVEGMLSGRRHLRDGAIVWQVDGNIGPGDSGGGLFNLDGKLLGICSFINLQGARFGFFVANDSIKQFLQ